MSTHRYRLLEVPEIAAGMRLDRFLARWFTDHSRSALAKGIRLDQVRDDTGKPLRASHTIRTGQRLLLFIPGIAPDSEPPPFPPILFEDDDLAVIDKPAGLMTHPAGNTFTWAVIGLAKELWPDADLVHRIDRDTSGVLVLSKNSKANRFLKAAFKEDRVHKEYDALCRGIIPWEFQSLQGRIGPADGPIRIQMAVRSDGQHARTDVRVSEHRTYGNGVSLTRVRCTLFTGRTHQIRVHLDHAGFPLIGDRMYGVPTDVFLHAWEHGVDESVIQAAGAPRHALHAAQISLPLPSGGNHTVDAPFPEDLSRWWDDANVLPLDGWSGETSPSDDAVPPDREIDN